MGKESINVKKIIIIAGALCAYWIGSGFATGQEVLQFLATSGAIKGIIGAIIYAILLGFFVYTLYGVGQKMQFEDPYDIFEYYCGKYIGKIYMWFSVILMYGIYVTMLAGSGATIHQYFGAPTNIGTYIVALLALGTAILGVEKLLDIIGVIGPIKIVFLTIMGISALVTLVGKPNLLSVNSVLIATAGFKIASNNWLWSAILWASLGLMFGITFFVISGSSCKSLKEARLSSIIGVSAISIEVVLLVITEIVYLDVIKGQQVPTLAIAKYISPILGMIFSLILILCIYSAVSSMIMVVTRKFAVDKTKRFNIVATILTLAGMFAGTLLPFDQLVNILYPVSGYIGILLVGLMIYKEFINKNAFPYSKNDKKIIENSGENITR
ncbi:hypothetical protein D4Z93_08345 [Clostridium fermenticellae]|uniref:Amino acid permease n=1 Tax=Clostridium fermenticellae TaxID=2068654 RepID=A0A386H4E6_9CLOT|nr:hypothetical protein [Clostridium fermenticellae]AYD40536.1 hypothetical protein D4Z93_08345 [Clostridium fermenticellae]